jgi:hypothetical protein
MRLCAYCGEPALALDEHNRPECARCRDLPVDPMEVAMFEAVERALFQIDAATFQTMTVQ